MPEPIAFLGAVAAGGSAAVAVAALAGRRRGLDAATWLEHRRAIRPQASRGRQRPLAWVLDTGGARERLERVIERAGWNESPERMTVFAIALSSSLALVGVAAASAMPLSNVAVAGVSGFTSGIGIFALFLRSAIASRRRRLAGELVPLLELLTLELSGGGSVLSALGSVTTKVQGELATDLRRLLIAAQVMGTNPFESRLIIYSEQLGIPALASLATILGASREYGTGVVHGVRALAMDLRHAQRRELIAHSRRALNHVLIPAAVGVLLPFLATVMFPAVTALQRNLH